ncbi:MAG TPA: hypothetical protein ENK58_02585 [Desulfobacterales bacterium]|nr:MAG: hypothetical protein DRI57_02725 [Deltaproteobacteria bacterium]HHC24291.1 hypothetical protein [Desulfobacterales bacterium]
MAFTDFKSVAQVQKKYNIRYEEEDFLEYRELSPPETFLDEFEFSLRNMDVFASEASRCENVIYPILREIYKSFVGRCSLWSHKSISYDSDLTGISDYIISTKSELGKTVLGLPIILVTEAKQNNFSEGWGQCLAEMLASQKINREEMLPVYGIVTDGEVWHFGMLVKDVFTKNRTRVPVDNIDRVFGAVSHLIEAAEKHRSASAKNGG